MFGSQLNDPAFFAMVHELLERSQQPQARRFDRHAFPLTQRVAPIINGEAPGPNGFQEVRCLDLSAGGFSFLTPHLPSSDELVIVLGTPTDSIRFMAEVMHTQAQHIVGCQFVKRLDG